MSTSPRLITTITLDSLRRTPLPEPGEGDDKNGRGRVLVVGGAREVPGAVILAGVAALRAGAGKLQLATVESVAAHVGVAVPEALVAWLRETKSGAIAAGAADEIAERANEVDAVLVGPGMMGERVVPRLLAELLPRLTSPAVVVDAAAVPGLADLPSPLRHLGGRAVITPHAGEMAGLLHMDVADVERDPVGVARRAAAALGAVVALKGPTTWVAAPDGRVMRYTEGKVGLATSGSGDTLAGVVAGLVARGAQPLLAAAWGVYLHGEAGNQLAERVGPIGFLARELLDQVPRVMRRARGPAA